MSAPQLDVGGQAVIEGVMMRSPRSFVVAVRKPNGEIVVREDLWRSLSGRFSFLKWPFFRGTVVLLEALQNGIQALTFSANHAVEEEEEEAELTPWAIWGTIAVSFALGIAFFVLLPHFLTLLSGRLFGKDLTVDSVLFHAIDGAIKATLFVGYVYVISFWKDIRRIFEYHGAEHKSIYAYENGEALTVENARKYPTLHPRCGTSFLIMVILVSIVLFSAIFPLLPTFPHWHRATRNLFYMLIKIPLMFPVAGLAYEVIRFSGKHPDHPLVKLFILPGLLLQKITTREPSDDQLEIALIALKRALWYEETGDAAAGTGGVRIYREAGLIL
ncbi:MAG: DUF1385 domain-containing protein [Deltaproteobacteria bacterium]|nr:MAG: DUF1385 domain-containing protein [Deltaproteobacteria bacterium]